MFISSAMRILIATDKFKGSLTQKDATQAIADGIRQVCPEAELDLCPLADGGEGTVQAVLTSVPGTCRTFEVCGPLAGMKVSAPIAFIQDGHTAVIELASASGLTLLNPSQYDPTRTTTFGTGELLRHAADNGVKKIILGIGGSATCDAGIGIAQAWGAAIRMINGKIYSSTDRKLCGKDVGMVLSIQPYHPSYRNYQSSLALADPASQAILDTRGIEFVVACDVGNPLYGPDGAAHIFAPQKGATSDQVRLLDEALRKLADRLQRQDLAMAPGAGAAGGVGFGMMVLFGASIVSGAELILGLSGFHERLVQADLVITGEGKLDSQTLAGKAPAVVARACKQAGKRCIAFTGVIGNGADRLLEEGLTSYFSITDQSMNPDQAFRQAALLLTDTVARTFRLLV